MRAARSGRRTFSRLRLPALLVLLIIWDVLGVLAELAFGSDLLNITGDKIGGLLGGRGAVGGALVVPLVVYTYAIFKGAAHYQPALWVAVVEQAATALFDVYHLARSDLRFGATIVPLAVALVLLVIVLVNIPRE